MQSFEKEFVSNQEIKKQTEYISKAVELYKQNHSLEKLIPEMKNYLDDYYDKFETILKPQSILESRYTSPEEAFLKGMKSCGIVTNIVTQMLRNVGFEVKKVHGSVPQSKDHAWINIKDPDTNTWKQYDFSFPNCEVTSEHKIIAECDEWSDIESEINKAHAEN